MFKLVSDATQLVYKWMRTIPTPIWAILVAPAVAIAGTEIQKFLDTRTFPEIDQNRIKVLEGRWGGYGIQPVTEQSSTSKPNAMTPIQGMRG